MTLLVISVSSPLGHKATAAVATTWAKFMAARPNYAAAATATAAAAAIRSNQSCHEIISASVSGSWKPCRSELARKNELWVWASHSCFKGPQLANHLMPWPGFEPTADNCSSLRDLWKEALLPEPLRPWWKWSEVESTWVPNSKSWKPFWTETGGWMTNWRKADSK